MRPTRRLSLIVVFTVLATLVVAPHTATADPPPPDTVEAVVDVDSGVAAIQADGLRSTEPTEAPITFNSLWLTLSVPAGSVDVRTSVDGENWSPWTVLEMLAAEDGPDPGSVESRATIVDIERASELLWVDEASWFQLRVPAEVDEVEVRLIDSDGLNESVWARTARLLAPRPAVAEAAGHPSWIRPRSSWGAAEPKRAPRVARNDVSLVVVHHTATPNGYTRESVPSRMRSMQSYHQGLGWDDLGYNIVIDRFGGVWEGRAGGVDRAVIGAHAADFNTGSFGVSVIGDYRDVEPSKASIDALSRVIGWKAGVHNFDPTGRVTFNGASRPVVLGHKDVGSTSCPGRISNYLPQIRASAAAQAYPFTDVRGTTHAESIVNLYRTPSSTGERIINGYANATFRPDQPITRAEAATLLSRFLGIAPVSGQRFSDVPSRNTHAGAINALVERGILTGYSSGEFKPDEQLRREHMAVILERALPGVTASPSGPGFTDVRLYHQEINGLANAGVTNGCARNPLRYCPTASVTRGEMASFLDRGWHLRAP